MAGYGDEYGYGDDEAKGIAGGIVKEPVRSSSS